MHRFNNSPETPEILENVSAVKKTISILLDARNRNSEDVSTLRFQNVFRICAQRDLDVSGLYFSVCTNSENVSAQYDSTLHRQSFQNFCCRHNNSLYFFFFETQKFCKVERFCSLKYYRTQLCLGFRLGV